MRNFKKFIFLLRVVPKVKLSSLVEKQSYLADHWLRAKEIVASAPQSFGPIAWGKFDVY